MVACRDAPSSSAMAALSSAPAHSRAVRGGSFSRTGRGPSGWTEAGPGPGAYQRVEQASRATLHSQPAFTFSSGCSARTCVSSCQILSVSFAELSPSAAAGVHAHVCPPFESSLYLLLSFHLQPRSKCTHMCVLLSNPLCIFC